MRPDSTIQWKAYPALLLAGCFAVGIALAASVERPSVWGWTVCAGGGFMLALGNQWYGRSRLVSLAPLLSTLAVGVVVLAAGGARYSDHRTLPMNHIARLLPDSSEATRPVSVEGRIVDTPTRSSSSIRFVLAANRLLVSKQETLAVQGRIQVTLAQPDWGHGVVYPPLQRGDVAWITGPLRPAPTRRNPADFDYGSYLRRHGIHATLRLYDAADVSVLRRERSGIDAIVVPAHVWVRDQLQRLIPTPEARAVLTALVLGDRSGLDEATEERFARTGLMHLLAVSGLHVLLVGMVLYGVLRPVLTRLRLRWQTMELTRAAGTLILLTFYMLLAGAGASVVRAVVMAGLLIGGTLLQRSSHTLNTLGVAALVLLLARPEHLFDVGFQLSFAAVGAIVSLHPRGLQVVPERWTTHATGRHLVTMVIVSLAATLGTLPVLLFHFGYASFAGLVLNVVAIPLTAATLGCGLLALLWAGVPFVALTFGAAADVFARLLLWTSEVGDAALSWAAVRTYVTNPWYLLCLIGVLVMLVQWPRPRLRWRLGVVALLFATVGLWLNVARGTYTSDLEVIFFDVGHGDAALVALPNGRHLLVDTGDRGRSSSQATWTILPHLHRYGIRRLDAVVITHPDGDHLGGLPDLLRSVPIRRVIDNGQAHASELYRETVHLLDSLRVPRQAVAAGDTLSLDPSVRIQVLSPDRSLTADGEANNASVVLRLVYGQTTFLLTGDAEAEAERHLLTRYNKLLPSTVVKVGHHGSATSSTPAFVRHAVPDTMRHPLAVVSVGNRFGLPNTEVLDRWRSRGADVVTTAREGALWLRSDGVHVTRVRWR